MTNSTLTTEPVGSLLPASVSFRWTAPDKPNSIYLSLDVVDRLEREVIESFKAVTKRGSEVGGVLLGRVAAGGGRTVFIENYETVPCEYSRGPLYLLAEPDKDALRAVLERFKGPSELDVVGYYRSNTRKDIIFDEEDIAIAEEYFPGLDPVFLLVKPFAMKPSTGAFFFKEESGIHGEASYLTFPFKRQELLKNWAQSIAEPGSAPASAREDRAPLVMPRREERATPIVSPVREERGALVMPKREDRTPAPVAPPKREEPAPAPPVAPVKVEEKKEPEKPAPQPAARREEQEPAPRPQPQAAPPLNLRRDTRPATPPPTRKEERPAPPVKAEEPPVAREKAAAPAKVEEPPKERFTAPAAPPKKEERPAVVLKSTPPAPKAEEPPAKREEPKPVRPAVKPEPPAAAASAVKEEVPAAAAPAPKREEPKRTERLFTSLSSSIDEEPELALPQPGFFSQPTGKRILIAVIAVVLIIGAIFLFRSMRSGPVQQAGPVDASSLALRVERTSGQLQLSWNRNADLIQRAQRATLSISDGDHKEDVDLDLGQLRTGNVVYSPLTNDVSFRLEVTDLKNGKSLSESVRVLAGRPSPSVVASTTAPAAKPELAPAERVPEQPVAPPVQQQPQAAAPAEVAPPAAPAQVTAVRPRPDSLAARLRPAAQIPEPPALEGGSLSSSGPSVPMSQTAVNTPAPPPAAPSAPAQQAGQVRAGGNVVPARVIRDSAPIYPAIARQARVSGVVRVQAVVGVDGKVKQAAAVSGPPLLRQAAADAVRRRLYEPTKLNGQPIEGQVQVDIAFTM